MHGIALAIEHVLCSSILLSSGLLTLASYHLRTTAIAIAITATIRNPQRDGVHRDIIP